MKRTLINQCPSDAVFQWPLSLYLHDNPDDDQKYQDWSPDDEVIQDSDLPVPVAELSSGQGSYIPFPITVPAPSYFIHRVRKDPYVKSKIKFESRPKLPPINETPSNPGTLTASEIAEIGNNPVSYFLKYVSPVPKINNSLYSVTGTLHIKPENYYC